MLIFRFTLMLFAALVIAASIIYFHCKNLTELNKNYFRMQKECQLRLTDVHNEFEVFKMTGTEDIIRLQKGMMDVERQLSELKKIKLPSE